VNDKRFDRTADTSGAALQDSIKRDVQSDLLGDWDVADVLWRIFRDAGDVRQESLAGLAELEISYCLCDFDTAMAEANKLIETAEYPVAIHARTMRMMILIANGDADGAYQDFCVLKKQCADGLAQHEDEQVYSTCLVSAMRIENVLMESLFNLPDLTEGGGADVPVGIKVYYGYLLAQRLLRLRRYGEASGVAYTNLILLSEKFPGSRTYLYLIEASANLILGDVERARSRFDKAWELKDRYGLLMPFIELYFVLLGLPRVNREEIAAPEEVKRVDAIVRSFHKGWYGLRRKCGFSCVMEPLTPLELITCSLVTLGWRNKEIAKHMLLSENTVKHQLTSAYQKLGITGRSGVRDAYEVAMSDSSGFGVWP